MARPSCLNRRNGRSQKHLKGKFGKVEIGVPRDRNSEYEPQIVKKGQTRWDGFDDKILSLYTRGMTTRDIQAQLQEMYGVEISHSLISQVTDSVMDEVRSWQSRPLSPVYPIVWLDALVVKVRENGRVINKAVHLALGVTLTGEKELLGIWMTGNEGAKFWMSVLTEFKNRGVQDIFIACVDGLTGFPDAIMTTFPRTQVQLCLVHLMRNSLSYVSYKHRKELAADLKSVYRASTEDEALLNLELFAEKWDKQFRKLEKNCVFNVPKGRSTMSPSDGLRRRCSTIPSSIATCSRCCDLKSFPPSVYRCCAMPYVPQLSCSS
jgi:putative transposase